MCAYDEAGGVSRRALSHLARGLASPRRPKLVPQNSDYLAHARARETCILALDDIFTHDTNTAICAYCG